MWAIRKCSCGWHEWLAFKAKVFYLGCRMRNSCEKIQQLCAQSLWFLDLSYALCVCGKSPNELKLQKKCRHLSIKRALMCVFCMNVVPRPYQTFWIMTDKKVLQGPPPLFDHGQQQAKLFFQGGKRWHFYVHYKSSKGSAILQNFPSALLPFLWTFLSRKKGDKGGATRTPD